MIRCEKFKKRKKEYCWNMDKKNSFLKNIKNKMSAKEAIRLGD